MATILSNGQVYRIKQIQSKIGQICPNDWMYEGYDGDANQFFNNKTEAYFIADFNGHIVTRSGHIPAEMAEVARLVGEISKIAQEEDK